MISHIKLEAAECFSSAPMHVVQARWDKDSGLVDQVEL